MTQGKKKRESRAAESKNEHVAPFVNEPAENDAVDLTSDADCGQTGEETPEEVLPEEVLTEELIDINELMQALMQVRSEKDDLESRLLRLQADFDNFRKRTRQEKEALIITANFELVKGILPVVDNLARGVAFGAKEKSAKESFIEGMQMILRQLQSQLESVGLSEITALGGDFDPNFHEAVLQEDMGENQSGKVVNELQKGYMFGDRLMRPSVVVVGK